jgi:hypothetical protein
MKKLALPKEVAEKFIEGYEMGDYEAFDYLRRENNEKGILDYDRECLLYALISMNTILNDYCWENIIKDFDKDLRPDFNEKWVLDLENKYSNSKETFINSFSNITFGDFGIEYVEVV